MSVLTTVPPGTQARIITAVLAAQHPRLALPTIAANFKLTLLEVQAILNKAGYPERTQMERAVERLRAPADTPPVEVQGKQLLSVPISRLHPDPDNLRDDVGDVTELAESIVAAGLLQDIVARNFPGQPGHYIVVAGHRRRAALITLGWDHVDIVVRHDMRPDDVLAAMIIENSQRADLDPIEEARGLLRLQNDYGIATHMELAHKIGRTQGHVSGRLALLALTPEEQQLVREGHLSLGAAEHRGRMNAGKIRPGAKGKKGAAHLSIDHKLGGRAQARCRAAGHKGGGPSSVGGIACGKCWESVIRADERLSLQERSATVGACALCDTPNGRATA